jgi:hypothetical protein
MRNKISLSILSGTLALSIVSVPLMASSSDTEDAPKKSSFRMPSLIKPLMMATLLFSGREVVKTQAMPVIDLYVELDFSSVTAKNYDDSIPPGSLSKTCTYNNTNYDFPIPKYSGVIFGSTNTWFDMSTIKCMYSQAKIERAWQIRETANTMYQEITQSSMSDAEKYTSLAAAINVELSSHLLELETFNTIVTTVAGGSGYGSNPNACAGTQTCILPSYYARKP